VLLCDLRQRHAGTAVLNHLLSVAGSCNLTKYVKVGPRKTAALPGGERQHGARQA